MADDPEGLVTFEAAGKKFTAVFGFRAMKAVEIHYDKPFFLAIASAMPRIAPGETNKKKIIAAVAQVRVTDLAKMFEFSLIQHHRSLTDDEVDDLIDALGLEAVSGILGRVVSAALVTEGDDGSGGNPP